MTKVSRQSSIEQEIADEASRNGLRLRLDRVALRVVGALRESLIGTVPEGEAVLFTITAPIRRPAETVSEIKALAQGAASGAQVGAAVHGNDVRVRRIAGVQAGMPAAVGFVHNRESRAELLLDLAAARLTGSGPSF